MGLWLCAGSAGSIKCGMKRDVGDVRGWRAAYGWICSGIYVMRKRKGRQAHRDRQGRLRASRQGRQGSSAADMQIDEPSEERERWGSM